MSANSHSQAPPRWAMLGAGCLTLLLAGFVLIGPGGKSVRAAEPSVHANAFQTTDKLLLALTVSNNGAKELTGDLTAELLDSDGKVVATKEQAIRQSDQTAVYRFEFSALKQKPQELTLRYSLGKHKVETPLTKQLLVKAHETSLSVGTEFHAGSTAALRCSVHGVKSITETVPLAKSAIEVRLKGKDNFVHELFKGHADERGAAAIDLKLPVLPSGSYKMEVVTRSGLGEEKLEKDVKIKAEPKVLLVSDKPLYQPGQLIHIRALCLGAFDLKPVADAKLTFEVEDSKGNKVFKREQDTTKQGVAAVDFQLASEVNQGEYRIRALLGGKTAEKSVTVKPYVLPKFKSDLKADRKFYAPKDTIKSDLQVDYFFGKPVAGGKYKVTASTFDVAFKDFQTVDGKTDEQGHAKFEIKLPDYFVGQPLDKGNALVKVEVKITDTADHTETITRTYPVSNKAIQVSLLPEAGRLVPGVENRVFVAALYPDGSPAECDVQLWLTRDVKGKHLGNQKTNAAGLAEFVFTPDPKLYRQGPHQQFDIELLGGKQQMWGPKQLFDLKVIVADTQGTKVESVHELTSEPFANNVMLRLDKAIYSGGDTLKLDVRSTAGTPTAYVDLVRDGQTLLTRWLDVKDGKATTSVDLPAEVFGTVEVHAYQMLAHGEIVRDARVIYVQPAKELKISVKADKDEYKPGEEGKIRFEVTDAQGNPTAAALGVIVVDEAVYALQEMQPGLEKVYFTLQEELMKPQAQAVFKPAETIDGLVRQPQVNANQQQIAQALMCAVRPKLPQAWNVDPALRRKHLFEQTVAAVGNGLFNAALHGLGGAAPIDRSSGQSRFKANLFEVARQHGWFPAELKTDPLGEPLTLDRLTALDPSFTPDNLARALTNYRMQQLASWVVQFSQPQAAKLFKDGKWTFPDDWFAGVVKQHNLKGWTADGWGGTIAFVKRDQKQEHLYPQFQHYTLISLGPDGKLGTADDFRFGDKAEWKFANPDMWADGRMLGDLGGVQEQRFWHRFGGPVRDFAMPPPAAPGGIGGGGGPPLPVATLGLDAVKSGPVREKQAGGKLQDQSKGEGGSGTPPMRLREYFPETMLWRPALVTDDRGQATLPLTFADSITTWRLTASASSAGGLLGGVSAPLRVFQDFFVDLDLPVALTRNDEVSFPVAVYNYLKTPQTVTLELVQEPWFVLVDGQAKRSLELKPGEVTAIKYRIRATRVGHQPLQVNARGSKMSDAIKRLVEVAPDGQMKEIVRTDRLNGRVAHTIHIPDNAIDDASKLIVKVYPGVFSQVLEGAEGLLRLPGGCFEQTSSSAYPNVLAVDYIKKMKLNTPAVLMKAEQYLNVGYQRLLTFERPGGGFDWWGSGEPLIWLSAYGLQEFNDMAKVWPVDPGIITRTQQWLMRQRDADGTWSKIGATHGESIERMGDAKVLLTSYVVWALADSGYRGRELDKSVAFIRSAAKQENNAYILALAANALAAIDPNDDSTLEVLKRLSKLKLELPEQKAACFPAGGQSLAYARGDSMTVETTALTALAMLRTKQFSNDANKCLLYLVKAKGAHGTWGSTQATILALKALVAGAGGTPQKDAVSFTVVVNGKKVGEGEISEKNSDVLQLFDLKEHTKVGNHEVTLEVKGETNMMYQIVGRYFEPWTTEEPKKPTLEVGVAYDRTALSTADLLKAKATLKYHGEVPTYQVIVDLPIPPGFKVDAGDFAELVAAKKVQRFDVTARQVILYVGDVKPGDVLHFEYGLKPKYPVKAKAPSAVAYEYYTPKNRAESKPVELTVSEK